MSENKNPNNNDEHDEKELPPTQLVCDTDEEDGSSDDGDLSEGEKAFLDELLEQGIAPDEIVKLLDDISQEELVEEPDPSEE